MLSRSARQLNSDFVCTTSAKRRMGSITTAAGPVSAVVCEPHCHIRGDIPYGIRCGSGNGLHVSF